MFNQLDLGAATPAQHGKIAPIRREFRTGLKNLRVPAVLFILCFVVFSRSPISQVGDSHYSMLLSLNLARHGSFMLDRYFAPPSVPVKDPNPQGQDWNLYPINYTIITQDHHYFYLPPPGTSVLSIPFVVLFDWFGLSSAKPDNTYDKNAEVKIQILLASFLMAAFVVLCFYLSRSLLPLGWSVLIAVATAFGTPIWSTATRAMWNHTWSVLLLGIVVKILVDQELGKRRLNPYILASLLSWMYFVRPSSNIMIAAVTVYVLLCQRGQFLKLALTGAAWLGLFLVYSQHYFHMWLPHYYHLYNSMGVSHGYFKALAGLLISPSRGILTCVPILFVVIATLIRYWRVLACRPLVWLAVFCISGTLLLYAATPYWHGGQSFGPRYSTDSIPWWVLLAVLSLHAILGAAKNIPGPIRKLKRRISLGMCFSVLLLGLGFFIHGRGAIAYDTGFTWSILPIPMELDIDRVWDWRRPQYMEGLTAISRRLADPSDPMSAAQPAGGTVATFPVLHLGKRVNLLSPDAEGYLLNFSPATAGERSTLTRHAEIHFTLDQQNTVQLRMYLQPYLSPGKLDSQKVEITLNGIVLTALTIHEPGWRPYTITLPRNYWEQQNILGIDLPDAASQTSLGISGGNDILRGIAILWIELIKEPTEDEELPAPVASAPLPVPAG